MNNKRRYEILVIEDNEINREIINEILKKDFNLLFAENGEIGMKLLSEHYLSIDIVLLDIEMPVMNGFEVLEAKGKDPLLKDIPVIVTTTNDSSSGEVRCLELGASDFVRKPYNPSVVMLRINNIINLRESNEANRQKSLFIQNISHEIRTPMNSILGYSQLLGLSDGELDGDERSLYLELITNSSCTLMNMIDNMIYLSELDRGSLSARDNPVAICNLCKQVIRDTNYGIPDGVNVHFSSDVSQDFQLCSDETFLKVILVSLISNAGKFSSEGDVQVHCSDKEKDGYFCISVTDNGIGVPKDKAEFIFERFAKIDSFVPGLGLGLTVARKIAKILDGEVYLDTGYGPGARFVLEIPCKTVNRDA